MAGDALWGPSQLPPASSRGQAGAALLGTTSEIPLSLASSPFPSSFPHSFPSASWERAGDKFATLGVSGFALGELT